MGDWQAEWEKNKYLCAGRVLLGWYEWGCGLPRGVCCSTAVVCLRACHHLLCPFSKPLTHFLWHTHPHTHTHSLTHSHVWHLSGWKGWKGLWCWVCELKKKREVLSHSTTLTLNKLKRTEIGLDVPADECDTVFLCRRRKKKVSFICYLETMIKRSD